MKLHFVIILLTIALPAVGEELPEMLKMRIEQITIIQKGKVDLIKEWPEDASGLFQGINREVDIEIISKEDHLAAIDSIPKRLMKDRVIGETFESNGWFYTSIERKDWKIKKATWFNVIASKKNSKILRFSYTW
jgi:hypothetical protein